MSDPLEASVKEICASVGNDRTRLLDICNEVQRRVRCVPSQAMNLIARFVGCSRVEVESVVSFYAFLSREPKGRIVIRVCNDIIDRFMGAEEVAAALADELGIEIGQTTPDGIFTLEYTPCIGMSDQAPAALVNDVVVTELSSQKARRMIHELRAHMEPRKLVQQLGDGNNAHPLVHAMVKNNIRNAGPFIFSPYHRGVATHKALSMNPHQVIETVRKAGLRGRGGAGFPTAVKWRFAQDSPGNKKYIICNADEGEPGTFKDRVILTERPDRMFAGMTIAAYAVGAQEGIVYLRAEYSYLREFLENHLEQRRRDGLLGRSVCGHADFNFDIRIQMGAGAYICGEETALISSCEGLRGVPKTRPPFPAQQGYLGCPTVVNNVETLCKVTKILEEGPASFAMYGSGNSKGTKLLSISGDCARPGVYEVPFGVTVSTVLELASGEGAIAVQISGPAGKLVPPHDFDHEISFDDLPTGGSIIIFGSGRDLLEIVDAFMAFFIEESCGYCTPCRVGNVLLRQRLGQIRKKQAEPSDLDYLRDLGRSIKATSRCGLGETSPNCILSSLENFPELYEQLVSPSTDGLKRTFDLAAAVSEAEAIAGRESIHAHAGNEVS